MYLPCCNLSVPLLSFPFAVVLCRLPVSENSTCMLLVIIANRPIAALLNFLYVSQLNQSACTFNKVSLTRRRFFMSPICTLMRSTPLLSPEIKVSLRRKKLECLLFTTFTVDYNDEIQKFLILRDLFWLDTVVFCKENIWNKSQKKKDWRENFVWIFIWPLWKFFYLCVWRQQIFKK